MKAGEIPNSLEAKTKIGLRRLMLQNNLLHKKTFVYSDFQFAQGKWHCWYFLKPEDMTDEDLAGLEVEYEKST